MWFRGHAQTNWELTPKIYRAPNRELVEYEDELREEFQDRAWPFLHAQIAEPKTDLEWYFLMQYFGMPTRLLDWTEGALIALYFALRREDEQPDVDAAVWVVNPFTLNRLIGTKKDELFSCRDWRALRHLPGLHSQRKLPAFPIPILPPYKSQRIAAQQGTFTMHGQSKRALDRYAGSTRFCRKIEIDRRKASVIREQLLAAGIAETSVFPELAGLSWELVDFYRYAHSK